MKKVELLAPAGSRDALVAGVNSGADAVYLGGTLFNARQFASNFTMKELKQAVLYCHQHEVKLYITVNTLVFNEELDTVIDYLYDLTQMGVDAVIVQDVGLLMLIKELLPQLPIHASTQMSIHNEFGAEYLYNKGVDRVVLARELSIADIMTVRQHSAIELEVFVHGALCFSYSGQCLFSSMVGGRSGNRGKCAQPCRLPYQLEEYKGNKKIGMISAPGDHILSPKDLNTIDHIPELIEAGVDSFKFEGRMKRAEYVAVVISTYRKALDRYLDDPNHFFILEEEQIALEQIFNRAFTQAYLFEDPNAQFISYTRPNNRGSFLGRVVDMDKGKAIIKLEEALSVGDGIQIWVSIGGRKGETVNRIYIDGESVDNAPKGALVTLDLPKGIKPGDRIFKTHDQQLMKRMEDSFLHAKEEDKHRLNLFLSGEVDRPLTVDVSDEHGHRIRVISKQNCTLAIKHPLDEDRLLAQLGRLGGTKYEIGSIQLNLTSALMLPISELNRIRREFVEKYDLLNEKSVSYPTKEEYVAGKEKFLTELFTSTHKPKSGIPGLSVKVGDYSSFQAALSSDVDTIYIPLLPLRNRTYALQNIKESILMGKAKKVRVIPYFPRILLPEGMALIHEKIKEIRDVYPTAVLVSNPGVIEWMGKNAPEIPLHGDYPLNITNASALKFYLKERLYSICLSPELNFTQLQSFPKDLIGSAECIIHGELPLMISRHCPVGALEGEGHGCKNRKPACSGRSFAIRDRKDFVFPIEMDRFCHMHLFNARVISIADDLQKLSEMGIGKYRLEMEREDSAMVSNVLQVYKEKLQDQSFDAKKSIQSLYPAGITKGHYYRGVL